MALTNKLTAIGDAIRNKTGSTNLLTLDEMPTAIESIEGGGSGGGDLPEEAFKLTGDCRYKFSCDTWNWFLDTYKDEITTQDLTRVEYMFNDSITLERVPFDLNAKSGTEIDMNHLFYNCIALKDSPKMKNFKPTATNYLFYQCQNLRTITEDNYENWDWSYFGGLTQSYAGNRANMFAGCYSLRSVPRSFLVHVNPNSNYNYTVLSSGFQNCYVLDELVDIPLPYTATYSSNIFSNAFSGCKRLKRVTFETNEDGTPLVKSWKGQTISLDTVGHHLYSSSTKAEDLNQISLDNAITSIVGYNSGITADKVIRNAETYALLKDDPDAFCLATTGDGDIKYSRYSRASAVETINSLPDTSEYLASKGGTNTIKFKGNAGTLTDSGAINTMTEEEIAVATAKGWTVTFV